MNKKSLLKTVTVETRKYKAGYIVKKLLCTHDDVTFPIDSAYNFKNKYIGSPKDARYLVVKRGIKPTLIDKNHSVCSIGYCKREKRWYGWGHRAICGFGIGDKLFDENYKIDQPESVRDNIPFIKHGSITIKTLKQAKQSAINFAKYIS